MNQRTPQSRRERRFQANRSNASPVNSTPVQLPGPLNFLTNPKVFKIMGVIMITAFIVSAFAGIVAVNSAPTDEDGIVRQMNELPDVPQSTPGADGTSQPQSTPEVTIKRYETAPPMTIDTAKTYTATVTTDKGPMTIELYASKAPQTVNSFVFLAREGYYNNNPAILFRQQDGSVFTTSFGDPTGTGNVRPGYTTPAERTGEAFARGVIGMGDSQTSGNDGRFWFSSAEAPSLSDRYTIFGKITSGADVLDRLAAGDKIVSITINES